MIHIPILRSGRPYRSLKLLDVRHVQSGEVLAHLSQANRGLISKDLSATTTHRKGLEAFSVSELLTICRKAARFFTEESLQLDGTLQSAEDYVKQVSGSTGMPEALCRINMDKIRSALERMGEILDGLTRGLDLSILDSGRGIQDGRPLSFFPQTDALGAVLPNNSPGVHSLWLPSIPLKIPLVLKPGSEEPWTPFRISQAFIAAGCPPEAFGYYPTDYSGASEILLRCGRSMLFGGGSTVTPWKVDPRIQIHGPGRSKIILGKDRVRDWGSYMEVMLGSIVDNGGRSCINASGIWVPEQGREIAEVLAERLSEIEPRPLDHPEAKLAAFSNPKMARRISETIDQQLKAPGAEEITTSSSSERVVEFDGCTFLRPTVIWCEDAEHPLANTEFLFPFVSVVQVPQEEILKRIGPTLTATAITEDEDFIGELLRSQDVDRLNLGAISTNLVSWDQPHEGNLFEHLYRQRALQMQGQGSDVGGRRSGERKIVRRQT